LEGKQEGPSQSKTTAEIEKFAIGFAEAAEEIAIVRTEKIHDKPKQLSYQGGVGNCLFTMRGVKRRA
jgi:hypothetical protein